MAYTTVADLKTYLGIENTNTADDTLLTTLIARAQSMIDAQVGRTFEAAADTARKFSYADIDGALLWFGADCAQITSVINGDSTVFVATEYWTQPINAKPYYGLKLKPQYGLAWDGWTDDITVTGRWAYSVTAPADIIQACTRLAAWLYRLRDNAQLDQAIITGNVTVLPATIPNDVATILGQYKQLAL